MSLYPSVSCSSSHCKRLNKLVTPTIQEKHPSLGITPRESSATASTDPSSRNCLQVASLNRKECNHHRIVHRRDCDSLLPTGKSRISAPAHHSYKMGKKRFYDAVRDLIRDGHDTPEQPSRSRRRLSIESLLAAPQTCAACWDQVPSVGPLFACHNCLSAFCPPCFTQYARSAIADRTLLPLRCADQKCRAPIPLSALRGLLSVDEVAKLSRFQCDMMRQPEEMSNTTIPAVPNDQRPDNEAALMSLMGSRGWKRCPDCGTGIERIHGCAHMVCVCGGEFCYTCGERWGVGGVGCPRRCVLQSTNLRRLLPNRLDDLRDEVRQRITAVLGSLRAHLDRDRVNRSAATETWHRELPPMPSLPHSVPPGRPVTRSVTRSVSNDSIYQVARPAKMGLRSLIHPTSENMM